MLGLLICCKISVCKEKFKLKFLKLLCLLDSCLYHFLARPEVFYVCMFCHQLKLISKCMQYFLKNMILIYHNFSQVVKDRKWKEVTMIFKYPSTITSASFVLRKYYQSLLYHFEQVYYFRKKIRPVLATGTCVLTLPMLLSANVSYPVDLNIKIGPISLSQIQ